MLSAQTLFRAPTWEVNTNIGKGSCQGLPAVASQQVDNIYRCQASIQMLHVHQDSKGYATGNVLPPLYQQDGP